MARCTYIHFLLVQLISSYTWVMCRYISYSVTNMCNHISLSLLSRELYICIYNTHYCTILCCVQLSKIISCIRLIAGIISSSTWLKGHKRDVIPQQITRDLIIVHVYLLFPVTVKSPVNWLMLTTVSLGKCTITHTSTCSPSMPE